uniref:GDSL esterase/lipase n=1 Tax=Physcomitrium patens TaxID=3218 RepID=A0A2K1L0Q1_PHYPA|nr:hypothetical protein PHYPA_002393 [Physcomitrium patens]
MPSSNTRFEILPTMAFLWICSQNSGKKMRGCGSWWHDVDGGHCASLSLESVVHSSHPGLCEWGLGILAHSSVLRAAAKHKNPSATFIFGDSHVDLGNNYIFSLAASNRQPYGIDGSDRQATGRFCNGKIIPDFGCEYLGTPSPLPVLSPEARELSPWSQLQTGYDLGMRKSIISNIGPIGCAPSVLSQRSQKGECVEEVNNYAIGFNAALKPMLESLGAELSNSIFLYTNAYAVVKAIIDNPLQHGFTDPVSTACFGVGKYNGIDRACRTISRPSPDRTKLVFWDAFHPKKVKKICNDQFLFGGLHAISPMNVKQLLAM